MLGEARQIVEDLLQRSFRSLSLELGEASVRGDISFVQEDDAAADLLHDVHDMRGIEDRLAFGGKLSENLLDDHDAVCVQSAERLVQKQQIRIVEQAGDEHHLLPHSFGIRIDPGIVHLFHPEETHQLGSLVFSVLRLQSVQLAAEGQVFPCAERIVDFSRFGDIADASFVGRRTVRQIMSKHLDRTAVPGFKSEHQLDRRAFARAVGADIPDDLAGIDFQVDALQHKFVAVIHPHVLQTDDGFSKLLGQCNQPPFGKLSVKISLASAPQDGDQAIADRHCDELRKQEIQEIGQKDEREAALHVGGSLRFLRNESEIQRSHDCEYEQAG
ncbi:hypothetical protein BN871_BF_00070 [Paenibacillus sp. P22]|nr:hypothetical protein BN871_BF_00070 [Paenibacillus sp. P22]